MYSKLSLKTFKSCFKLFPFDTVLYLVEYLFRVVWRFGLVKFLRKVSAATGIEEYSINQCCGSRSGFTWIPIDALLDPDPYPGNLLRMRIRIR
jgi:hypothetical protein